MMVTKITQAYREESDPLTEFIGEYCVVAKDAHVSAADLWRTYSSWAANNGERFSLDRRSFTRRLQARGLAKMQHGHHRAWTWFGIGLRPAELDPETELPI